MEDEPEPAEWQEGHQRALFIGSLGWNNEDIYLHPESQRPTRAIGRAALSKEVAYEGEW
jgi:hypothetical protein